MMRTLNLDGDGQADLRVHGGIDKAVYAYPAEHYAYWREQLGITLPWGAFGENLTIEGLLEDGVGVGDRLRVGEAEVVVTQPRFPCSKLGARFRRRDMVTWFLESRRTGFYVSVLREGRVAARDGVEIVARDAGRVSISEFVRVQAFDKADVAALRRLIDAPALPEKWRERFARQLQAAVSGAVSP
jgi:MOSC domain-containing protein YiiM